MSSVSENFGRNGVNETSTKWALKLRVKPPRTPEGVAFGFGFRLVLSVVYFFIAAVSLLFIGVLSSWELTPFGSGCIIFMIVISVFFGELVRLKMFERILVSKDGFAEFEISSRGINFEPAGGPEKSAGFSESQSDFTFDPESSGFLSNSRNPTAFRFFKRVVDITIAVHALPAVFVLTAIMLALNPFYNRGPVFYVQTRVGLSGRTFRLIKFRTMRVDAEDQLARLLASDPVALQEWKQYQKLRDDPRITPIGSFFRKTALDEFPQSINVLLGDMSIVGPRPVVWSGIPGYPSDKEYAEGPYFCDYIACKPGIIGVSFDPTKPGFSNRVAANQWYSKNRSISLDFVIMMRVLRRMLFGGTL